MLQRPPTCTQFVQKMLAGDVPGCWVLTVWHPLVVGRIYHLADYGVGGVFVGWDAHGVGDGHHGGEGEEELEAHFGWVVGF